MVTTTGKAITDAQEFLEASRIFLKKDFLPKLKRCLEGMSESDIWWRPNEQSNSVGNLVLHLRGNLRQWILNSIGGAQFERDREAEFSARPPRPKVELLANIEETIDEVDRVLGSVDGLLERFSAADLQYDAAPRDLSRRRTLQLSPWTNCLHL